MEWRENVNLIFPLTPCYNPEPLKWASVSGAERIISCLHPSLWTSVHDRLNIRFKAGTKTWMTPRWKHITTGNSSGLHCVLHNNTIIIIWRGGLKNHFWQSCLSTLKSTDFYLLLECWYLPNSSGKHSANKSGSVILQLAWWITVWYSRICHPLDLLRSDVFVFDEECEPTAQTSVVPSIEFFFLFGRHLWLTIDK